jgi:hypothetical protein
MNDFHLAATPKTPLVQFNSASGILRLEGKSIPENSVEFYRPLLEWLEEYAQQPAANTVLELCLEYFNTSSSKCILDLFRKLEQLKSTNPVAIFWYYDADDEDMREVGEDYQALLQVPITLVALEE